jgi:hypothetical protein
MSRSILAEIAVVLASLSGTALAEPSGAQGAPAADSAAGGPTSVETQLALAKAHAAVEKDKAEEAKDQLALLKNGKLMSLGFTGGAAAAVHVPYGDKTGLGITAMPYVMVLPVYWWTPEATRAYCASSWLAGDEHAAHTAASAIARSYAKRQLAAVKSAIANKIGDDQIIQRYFTQQDTQVSRKLVAKAHDLFGSPNPSEGGSHAQGGPQPEVRVPAPEQVEELLDTLSNLQWNPLKPGWCIGKKFGGWVGLPANYDTTLDGVDAEFDSTLALGLGFSPNAYFSLLAGATTGTIARADGTEERSWVLTIAIGGNLDLLGTVFK